MSEVEITIDQSRGLVSVRGERDFVLSMLEQYRFVYEQFSVEGGERRPGTGSKHAKPNEAKTSESSELSTLDNVYDVTDNVINVIATPPGNGSASQAKSLILLYLYARHLLSSEPASSDDIRAQCKEHACLDSGNFGKHLRGQKSLVAVTGSGSSMHARLTAPGRKAALELAQKLQGD